MLSNEYFSRGRDKVGRIIEFGHGFSLHPLLGQDEAHWLQPWPPTASGFADLHGAIREVVRRRAPLSATHSKSPFVQVLRKLCSARPLNRRFEGKQPYDGCGCVWVPPVDRSWTVECRSQCWVLQSMADGGASRGASHIRLFRPVRWLPQNGPAKSLSSSQVS